jgi:DNA-3-methyladenine glycosylase II
MPTAITAPPDPPRGPSVTDSIRYSADDKPSRALAAADPAMAALIARVGSVEFTPTMIESRFAALVRGVAGQQLSGAAAERIYERLNDAVGITPEALASATEADLVGVGLSHRKAEYIGDLARAILCGKLPLDTVDECSDDEIVEMLTRQRGIGPWTAHMFLLFSLRRPDVMAPGDLGIRQAIGRLLDLGREATPAEVTEAAERWRPYRSAATFYLYRDAGMGRSPEKSGEADAQRG